MENLTSGEKLKRLLELEIIPDLEGAIDGVFEEIESAKGATNRQKNEIKDLQEMRDECREIIIELNKNELKNDEIEEILSELMDSKSN
jgi:DNA-binding transcriptional regulator YhcF (GntR family)